jgi:hypothetical protein
MTMEEEASCSGSTKKGWKALAVNPKLFSLRDL